MRFRCSKFRPVRGVATAGLAASAVLLASLVLAPRAASAADTPGCEPQQIKAKYPALAGKTFRVAISAADKPNTYRDDKDPDKLTGFDVEYARAAFACIGAPIEFFVGGWSGLMPALIAGQTDVMWDALYYTPERAKSLDYVLYSSAGSAIVARKGNPKNIHALSDLCGLKAVSQLGSTEIATLQRTSQACRDAGKREIDVTIAQDRPSGLRELANDRVDAYLGIGSVASYDAALYEIAYSYNSGIKVGVGVRKGDKELEQALSDAIRQLQADGTAQKLYETFQLNPALSVAAEILLE